jgi:PAS domain S-box-containing protein
VTTLPQPVPDSALHRLRRSYALLMLGLGLPVLAAIVYVLYVQFQIVAVGTQRQIAMSTDRRLTRLDAVLAPLRDDLLRLRNASEAPSIVSDMPVERGALADTGQAHTLDGVPSVLQDRVPQVLLVGGERRDPRWRAAAVEQAGVFAQQARVVERSAIRRVYYVDAAATQLWVYPWVRSDELLAELKADSPAAAVRMLAQRHAAVLGAAAALRDAVDWRSDGARITATTGMTLQERPGTLTAELAPAALDAARVDAGIGRFWLLDAGGRIVWDYRARDQPGTPALVDGPPAVPLAQIDAALGAPIAVDTGSLLLSARPSSVAPWRGLYASDRAHVRRLVLNDIGPYAAGGAALLLLFLATAALLWQRFARPSLRLVDYLHRKAFDATAPEPALPRAWMPWLTLTRDSFGAAREAQAREQQALTLKSAIVDHALAAIVSTDAHGRIVEFNPAAEAMFGRARDGALGRPVSDLIVPQRYRAAHEAGMERLRHGDAPRLLGRRVEMAALRADGSEFPVEMVLWRTEVDAESHYTASFTDLSERRAAAQQIEQQREALRQSEKLTAMGSLLAGVAHELNNPLAIVMGRASLLEEKCEDAPQLRADAQRIREAAERCGRIVRTFLNMARQKPTERRNVALNDLVRAAIDMLGYTFRSHGIEVQLDLGAELPDVQADADQIGQVVLNLLVNAQQSLASAAGERRVTVTSGVEERRDNREPRVWLRVADNGTGVRDELRDKIFEPFFTTKPEGIGTGLGLAVSRSLVREHGGDLRLERSELGAVFRLTLPISGQPAGPLSEPGGLGGVAEPSSARVLVVDDEAEIADLMRAMLESAGYEVATAESGAVALELLEMARFDAIVSDLRMPDMDGATLWRSVGAAHPALARRMLFVTGDTLSPDARSFLETTRCTALDKPFAKSDLLERVAGMLTPP